MKINGPEGTFCCKASANSSFTNPWNRAFFTRYFSLLVPCKSSFKWILQNAPHQSFVFWISDSYTFVKFPVILMWKQTCPKEFSEDLHNSLFYFISIERVMINFLAESYDPPHDLTIHGSVSLTLISLLVSIYIIRIENAQSCA